MEEVELVMRFKEGDRQAFDCLYERYRDTVLRMALLIAGSRADSEDIVQETFIKGYLNIHSLREADKFRPWLFQILTRTAYAFCTKRKREFPDEEMIQMADRQTADHSLESVMQEEQTGIVSKAVGQLEIRQRTVVVLFYYNQLSLKEIAQITGSLEGTVKSRLFTARKKLKTLLATEMEWEAW